MGTHGTLWFPHQHIWGSEPNTPVNGLCVLMGIKRVARSGEGVKHGKSRDRKYSVR